MLSISNILCDHKAGNEHLRYGHVPEITLAPGSQPTPKPVVVWAVTKACNLKCVHCYASAQPEAQSGELTHQEAIMLLDDLKKFGAPAVLFSGGEPLVRPDTPELIAYAKSIGLPCTLSTNGLLIDDAMADRLAALGLKYAGISIDGTAARHDKLRGKVGAYEQTVAAIDRCRARGIKVGVRFTVHALNREDLDAIITLCIEHEVQRLCIYHLAYAGRGGSMQKVDLAGHETRQVMDTIIERTRAAHAAGHNLEVLTVGNHADAAYALLRLEKEAPERVQQTHKLLAASGGNRSGCNIASIDPLGNVHYDQFSWHYNCGNIKQQSFSQIWSEATDPRLAILRDRQSHLTPRCQACRFVDVCNGNLRTRAESATGDWLGMDPSCYLTDEEIRITTKEEPNMLGSAPTATAVVLETSAAASKKKSVPTAYTITSRVTSPPLELAADTRCFAPNPTTVRFARAVKINPQDLVFDIGTGIGPLAIMAGMSGAGRVVGVDPVPLHVKLARQNVAHYDLQDRVEIHQGEFFSPFLTERGLQDLWADVIIGDVSGIADHVARALGWYPENVPTGGHDGTDILCAFLKQAPRFLKEEGRLYFPIAVDLSNSRRVLDLANKLFGVVENAMPKPYIDFPLTPQEHQAIINAYDGQLPFFIQIQEGRTPYWRGQILVASQPFR